MTCPKTKKKSFGKIYLKFLPAVSFGLRVLSLPASECVSVCLSVCLSVCQSLACPRDNSGPINLGSPNLDQRCKRPWLTHWGRVTHLCVGNLTIIGSDDRLSPGRRQTIIWTNTGILLVGPLGTNFNEIAIGIQTFSVKKMHFKMSSGKWRPLYLILSIYYYIMG